ncbi:MAG: SpoIID/LytB domain-containing protein [Spirulinaceae cyanobacterium]
MMVERKSQGSKKKLIFRGLGAMISFICIAGLAVAFAPKEEETKQKENTDVILEVGVVQRFGEESTDELTISATGGGKLTLQFLAGDMSSTTVEVQEVKVQLSSTPLAEPKVVEKVILSDRSTFETAEDSSLGWEELGVATEVTQPGRWQVWAKRDVYQTPLLRRLLLETLQAQGYQDTYLETEVLETEKKIAFTVGGYRYNRQKLTITADNELIQVLDQEDKRSPYLYSGYLEFQPNAYDDFSLVNHVPLETYLRGVVPHEIGPNAPYNAVEAQTIIARTYALRNLRRFKADDYQLCATVHCQVYRGLSGTSASADKAIAATTGLVLTYENELVDALYSAATGGVTASFGDIWDGEKRPYLQPVIDSPNPMWDLSQKPLENEANFRQFIASKAGFNESDVDAFRWNKQSSIEQLTKDLQRYLTNTKSPLAGFTTINKMEITERSPSGRVLTLTAETDKGLVELHKNEARSAFGPPRSTLFYLEPVYGANQNLTAYKFIGGGFGHGVGMSQYGSYNLANLGWSSQKILDFYYPNTEIKPLDDSIVFFPE